jgi:hypothetical protein
MKEKIDLSKVHPSKVFGGYIYPLFAREFLFMNNYDQFASIIQLHAVLTSEQWETILNEWEVKEQLLSV